jgi:hypothetical protein
MRTLPCLLVAAVISVLPARAMSPEEAYAAIPHRRTTFDPGTSKLPRAQAEGLQRLFALSDQGVILRVEGMQAHRSRNAAELARVLKAYDALIEQLRAGQFVAEALPVRDLVVEALRGQKRFIAAKPAGGIKFERKELAMTPDVKQASGQLQQAYGLLLKAYPGEGVRNKTSFYDYLCALDYL